VPKVPENIAGGLRYIAYLLLPTTLFTASELCGVVADQLEYLEGRFLRLTPTTFRGIRFILLAAAAVAFVAMLITVTARARWPPMKRLELRWTDAGSLPLWRRVVLILLLIAMPTLWLAFQTNVRPNLVSNEVARVDLPQPAIPAVPDRRSPSLNTGQSDAEGAWLMVVNSSRAYEGRTLRESWSASASATNGDTVSVRIFVNNDSCYENDRPNATRNYCPESTAHDAYVLALFSPQGITAIVAAANAEPIQRRVNVPLPEGLRLRYKPGSARSIQHPFSVAGMPDVARTETFLIEDGIAERGIGLGDLIGGYVSSRYIVFQAEVEPIQAVRLDVRAKNVSRDGTYQIPAWASSGEIVRMRINVENIRTSSINARLKAQLPTRRDWWLTPIATVDLTSTASRQGLFVSSPATVGVNDRTKAALSYVPGSTRLEILGAAPIMIPDVAGDGPLFSDQGILLALAPGANAQMFVYFDLLLVDEP
jgi:hypothetical protein